MMLTILPWFLSLSFAFFLSLSLFLGVDSTSAGEGPIEDNRPYMALFFVLYIVAMHFFMINVFVGYVVMTFASEGEFDLGVDS